MRLAVFLTLSLLQGQSWYEVHTWAGAGDTGDGKAATSARFLSLTGIAVDPTGNVYLSDTDTHRIRKINPAGIVSNFAGTGIAGYSGDGGLALNATFNYPYGLATDYAGNVYIADLGNARIRKIATDGKIQTIAGHTPETKLTSPRNVAVDGPGNVLISDFRAHRVYRLTAAGLVPFAGVGRAGDAGDGGLATVAYLNSPAGLAFDPAGNLFIGDTGNRKVRKVALDGRISTVAADALQPIVATGMTHTFSGELWIPDGNGGTLMQVVPQQQSAVAFPFAAMDAASDFAGNVYAAGGDIVRRIAAKDKKVTLFAGGLPYRFAGDGEAAAQSRMNRPSGLAMDPSTGVVYISDSGNGRVRRVFPLTGNIDTFLDGFQNPQGLWWDSRTATLYIADAEANAVYRWKAGLPKQEAVAEGETADLKGPLGVATDDAGNVWIADTGNNRIRVVDSVNGTIRTALSGLQQPTGVTWNPVQAAVYVAETGAAQILRIAPNRPGAPLALKAEGIWTKPRAVAFDASGAMLVADEGTNRVTRTGLNESEPQAIAGNGEAGFDGDTKNYAVAAKFAGPAALLVDSFGDILVADSGNHRVRSLEVGGDAAGPVVAPPDNKPATLQILHGASKLPVTTAAPGMLLAVPVDGEISIQGQPATFVGEGLMQVPETVRGLREFEMTYAKLGVVLERRWLAVVDALPGVFPAILNTSDATLNSQLNPVARGSLVTLRITGEGSSPLRVRIRGSECTIADRQPAADLPGATDLTVRVPSGYFAAGGATVVVDAGNGAVSQDGVMLWIR
ncbi:MAG: SMP-30/gluconolactonase/LRE family protein [Acidobacteria bacterium]|nr:SMP-30/gluconolactonase/LRE family protein [Acidobacteriota bacterium]